MADPTVTVTGLTATRMLEIEGRSVVDGEVVGDNLILLRRNGEEIVAGNVRGPEGSGGGEDWEATFYFSVASLLWSVQHNQDSEALVVVTIDQDGEEVEGNVTYPTPNTVEVEWSIPTAGRMILRK